MKIKILLTLLLLGLYTVLLKASQLKIDELKVENRNNPIGIEEKEPAFSWMISADSTIFDVMQTAYEIQVAKSVEDLKQEKDLVWSSGKVKSNRSVYVRYLGKPLDAKQRYYWRVRVWNTNKKVCKWSTPAFFETGLCDISAWKAKWVMAPDAENQTSPLFRRDFMVEKPIVKARLYISSRGLYKATINGQQVTDALFTPGWTSYHNRLQYQVYDVSDLLTDGNNATGIVMANGWYRGGFFEKRREEYGDKLAFIYQLEIEYADGSTELILSDENWKSNISPYKVASIYDGVTYDARLEMPDWDQADSSDKNWSKIELIDFPLENLVPSIGEEVKRIEEVYAIKKIITPSGETVLDFGQNLTGRVKFSLTGQAGDSITLYHAEVLDSKGNFYTDNLRTAKQQVRYIFKDNKLVIFEPDFTFQGFRYIKIEDFKGHINKENFVAVVIHSDMKATLKFECSDERVNKLVNNIKWGMRGNFLDVPTDCPQRDERCGWTGDVQVFCSTANYLYNTASFFNKWLLDVKVEQRKDGAIPHVVPKTFNGYGSTGWGDVATVLPYQLYMSFGDQRVLEDNYEMMKSWVDYLVSISNEDGIVIGGSPHGDWLFYIHPTDWTDKPGYTDKDLISTAFLAYSASIVAKSAQILGQESDFEKYTKINTNTKQAFQKEYLSASGRLSSHSQTAYALALQFDLMPEDKRNRALNYLVENIKSRNYHLSTGFLGTPYLCHVLTDNGANDVAYKLLLQDTYPSWLYPITKGATTVWERWDGIKPNGQFQTPRMNSFNHYAYGAIGSWLFQKVGGIITDEANPGFKHIVIQPQPDESLGYVNVEFTSQYGLIRSSWQFENGQFNMQVSIPVNTTATIHVPFTEEIREVGSGDYQFEYTLEEGAFNNLKSE